MRIFLTGGSGFIGSNLILKLLEQGHDVYALTRYVSNRTPNYPKEVQVVFGDLRDSLMLKKSIREITPEVVVHLGAISPVQRSFGHSQEVFETNTMGTMNLADANLENPNLEKFIFAGTSEMYGDQLLSDSTRPLHEIDILKPNQPYAISKVAASNYLNYLSKAYDFPICVARPFNTYGRTENFNFVTERIIHGMLTKNSITLGNPDPVRDLLYVDDHVEGYLKIINSTVFPEAVNFCTGVGTSIRELAETIKEKLDWTGEIYWGRTMKRPTEIDCLIGDNSLAKETLGWEPKINLDKGLNLTISKINKKLENLE